MQFHGTMQSLYVAIDVGKNVHCYAAYVDTDLAAGAARLRCALRPVVTSAAAKPVFRTLPIE